MRPAPVPSTVSRRRRGLAALGALALVLAACGGGDDEPSATEPAPSGTESAEPTDPPAGSGAPATDPAPEPTDGGGSGGTFEPGEQQYRVVNLLAEPVDLVARTTGFVEAYPLESGVAPGSVTDLFAPPAAGTFIVATAGAEDLTCVATCPQFLAQLSEWPETGPVRTIVMYDRGGTPSSYDIWEQPDESLTGNANAMPPADPATGIVVVTAFAVTGADFGLRLAVDGTPGCVEPFNLEGILVGGNQTPAFTFDDDTDLVLHDNTDRECAGAPVGGPFTVPFSPGSRTHLVLTGSPGSMDGLVLPFVDSGAPVAPGAGDGGGESGSGEESSGGDDQRARAIELMTPEVEAGLGLPPDQAACATEFLVDAIGPDVLLVDGELVDLDTALTDYEQVATDALIAAVPVCGIDPNALG